VIGFIKGLFGSNTPSEDEILQSKDAYYLPADDAKTFGNIDYMRSVKKTRRTFPKQAVGENNEFIQEVSATAKVNAADKPIVNSSPFNGYPVQPVKSAESTAAAQSEAKSGDRRQADNSMDMFRNMARQIKQ
jgi:hypothetical protein